MHERRVFIDEELKLGDEISVSDKDAYHLKTVLRAEEGSPVTVVQKSNGTEYHAFVTAVTPSIRLKLRSITDKNKSAVSPVRSLTFSLCKNSINDLVCEKAAELGVENLILWCSKRSIVKITKDDREKKIERWQKIAESAAKQSGKQKLMQIHIALTMEELASKIKSIRDPSERLFCCSLTEGAMPLRKITTSFSSCHLLVGPAGDLTVEEELKLVEHGFELITLGPYLLRAETAAIVAISTIHAICGFGEGTSS